MSLAEIMAKKRATAALPQVQTEQPKEEIVQHSFVSSLNEVIIPPSIIPPSIIKEETAVMQVEKPMSFAERMLLKKKLTGNISQAIAVAGSVGPATVALNTITVDQPQTVTLETDVSAVKKVQAVSILAPVEIAPTASIPVQVDTMMPAEPEDKLNTEEQATPETEQAYADISRRIEALTAFSDTALENAMSELKVALLANPNAVSLMEDTDYGKMVVALRIMTKEAAVDALKEKISGKKSKIKLSLSPEDVAAAFEEI